MPELAIASSEADANAAELIRQHHAVLAGALALHAETLFAAASRPDLSVIEAGAEAARRELVDWCERDLVPHARAEEQVMYPAARSTVEGQLLIDAMLGEHELLVRLVHEVADAAFPPKAAASATALRAVFDSHLAKENDLVVPLLAAIPGISLAELLDGMHQLLEDEPEHAPSDTDGAGTGCGGHACTCGEADSAGYPELDVRSIPHSIRHPTIFGALESLRPAGGIELVAPHDPLPLLDQVQQRWPGTFLVSYSERGPETWRLSLVRAE